MNQSLYEDFSKDKKTQYALIKAIEVIGEVSQKVPNKVKSQSREISLREIGGMRNLLIHD